MEHPLSYRFAPLRSISASRFAAGANIDALWLQLASSFAWATCGHSSYINTASSTGAASLLIVEKVLAGAVKPGFQTPSLAFGPDLVMEIEGVTRTDVYLAR